MINNGQRKDEDIYGLICEDKHDKNKKKYVYIGVSGNIKDRIQAHREERKIHNCYILKRKSSFAKSDEQTMTEIFAMQLTPKGVRGGQYVHPTSILILV